MRHPHLTPREVAYLCLQAGMPSEVFVKLTNGELERFIEFIPEREYKKNLHRYRKWQESNDA